MGQAGVTINEQEYRPRTALLPLRGQTAVTPGAAAEDH